MPAALPDGSSPPPAETARERLKEHEKKLKAWIQPTNLPDLNRIKHPCYIPPTDLETHRASIRECCCHVGVYLVFKGAICLYENVWLKTLKT